MKKRILEKIAKLAEKRSLLMIVIGLVITIVAGGLSESLELKMNFKDLMPQSHPTVIEYDNIINNYSAASNIIIAATGEENELKQFADDIAPKVEAMEEYIQRVNYKVNRKFIEEHAFILTKTKDLKNSKDMYNNLGILPFITEMNNQLERYCFIFFHRNRSSQLRSEVVANFKKSNPREEILNFILNAELNQIFQLILNSIY